MSIPWRVASFLAGRVVKLAGFQMKLVWRFINFPVMISNYCIIFMFESSKRNLVRICRRINSCRYDMMKLVVRFCWGVLWSVYVLMVLGGLVVLGFAVSGIVMRSFRESPIHVTQNLYFDYTKTSPSAVVPITASRSPSSPGLGRRANHRFRLTITLTLPESDYNRKLGVFQVRVESLSAKGDVIVSSSYPTMLRFKSQTIRVIESSIKIIPHITGMKSDGQNLVISVEEFLQGDYQIVAFKVSLEKRAELEDGCGLPEIYGATLDIASKLPLLHGMVWHWRLTIFVWTAFTSFMAEIILILLCCTPLLLPGTRSRLHQHFQN